VALADADGRLGAREMTTPKPSAATISLRRFLFDELLIAVGSTERVLKSMRVSSGAETPYRGLVAGAATLDPETEKRVVRIRRMIAATYATLGLVIPSFAAIRIGVVGLGNMKLDDPVSIAVTIAVTLLLVSVIGGVLAFVGLFIARPVVDALLKREERRASR
jgi:Flp pilus assembly protein protease CpaA